MSSRSIQIHPEFAEGRLLQQIPKDEGQAQGYGRHTEANGPKHLDRMVRMMGMSETLPAQLTFFATLLLDVDIYRSNSHRNRFIPATVRKHSTWAWDFPHLANVRPGMGRRTPRQWPRTAKNGQHSPHCWRPTKSRTSLSPGRQASRLNRQLGGLYIYIYG